jgi:hypothetical protein
LFLLLLLLFLLFLLLCHNFDLVLVEGQRQSCNSDSSYEPLRDFHTIAGGIGISRDIAATYNTLKELTQILRHKSLFQDDTPKVNELEVRNKASIENLNRHFDAAERKIAQQKRTLGKFHNRSHTLHASTQLFQWSRLRRQNFCQQHASLPREVNPAWSTTTTTTITKLEDSDKIVAVTSRLNKCVISIRQQVVNLVIVLPRPTF